MLYSLGGGGYFMTFDLIFKNKIPQSEKLIAFGFVEDGEYYRYHCGIMDGQFNLTVMVSKNGNTKVKVVDAETGDEYVLHQAEGAIGSFVGKVKNSCLDVLQQIAESCFEKRVFKSEFAGKIISYVKEKYKGDFEFLWEKFPENAIVRRHDNKKWYAALLTVSRCKIGLAGCDKIEIIDLRMVPEDIEKFVDGKKYFWGYHMNKKHWVTLCLDGSVPLKEIFERIDASYHLAEK